MEGYDASTYRERMAQRYDERWALLDPEAAVADLAELARGGRALELGIGTGRVALPLAARGVEVHGLDASEQMVARLRQKEGGARIPVTMGDFADVAVEGTFALVYVAFNTFFALETQDLQVRSFRNVAARLERDGVFVVEAFVPDMTRFHRGQRAGAIRVERDEVELEASLHDPVAQRITSQHVVLGVDGVRLYPISIRYAWPA